MLDLSVSDYNRFQAEGIPGLSMAVVWAFNPAHFALTGYPSTIQTERELYRFIDSMAGGALEEIISYYLQGGITQEEFTNIQRVAARVQSFMSNRFESRMFPRGSLIRTLNVQRHIRYLFPNETPSVLELGPGGGMLGALLTSLGHAYAGTDVTQGFYILQNHLWNYLSEGKLVELAGNPGRKIEPTVGKPTHIPWWEFSRLRADTAPKFDVITCNHVLCEMHNWSMRFALSLGRSILSGQDKSRFFVFENWGSYQAVGLKKFCEEAFNQFGYRPVFNDDLINVFASPQSKPCDIDEMRQRILQGRANDQAQRIIKQKEIEEFFVQLTGGQENLSEDDKFFEFIGGTAHGYPILFEIWPQIADQRVPALEGQYQQLAQATVQIYNEVTRLQGAAEDKARIR